MQRYTFTNLLDMIKGSQVTGKPEAKAIGLKEQSLSG
jgi:hypothetical protein